jgi:hypothetical protein
LCLPALCLPIGATTRVRPYVAAAIFSSACGMGVSFRSE